MLSLVVEDLSNSFSAPGLKATMLFEMSFQDL